MFRWFKRLFATARVVDDALRHSEMRALRSHHETLVKQRGKKYADAKINEYLDENEDRMLDEIRERRLYGKPSLEQLERDQEDMEWLARWHEEHLDL